MAFPFPQMSRRRSSFGRSAFGRSGHSRGGFGSGRRRGIPIRLLIGLAIVGFSLISYFFKSDTNPITGKEQRVALEDEQDEVAIGLQAAPEMIQQHGGEIGGPAGQAVDQIGAELVRAMEVRYLEGRQSPYPFEFYLLADPQTVNAFALPGGQVFITRALYDRLGNRGQLAGVLGHEIGHVIERHGNQRMAEQKRNQGLMSGVAVASGSYDMANMAQMALQVSSMSHGREQELESDVWGVQLMPLAGYDPRELIEVMNILEAASGGAKGPEFASTHPDPGNRRETISTAISQLPAGALDNVSGRLTGEPLPPVQSRGRSGGGSLFDLLGR